jgi:hypothetical protein
MRVEITSANRVRAFLRGNNATSHTTAYITVTGGYAVLICCILTFNAATRTATLYINDTQSASVTLPEGVAPVAANRFNIGALTSAGTVYLSGAADETAVAQRIWTAEEQTRFCAGMGYPG